MRIDAAYARGVADGQAQANALAKLDLDRARTERLQALRGQAVNIVAHLAEAIEHVMSTAHRA